MAKQKLKRHWPGKAPDENQDMRMTTTEKAFPCHNDNDDIVQRDDSLADFRLRRLEKSKMDNIEEIRAHHRRIRKAERLSTVEEGNTRQEWLNLEEEEDALVEKRKKIKESVLRRQQEDASLLPEEEEEEESEYEYEIESDEQLGIGMLVPVFVIKSERDTIAERGRLEAKDRVLEDLTEEKLKKRKIETKQIVAEEIRKDEQIQKNLKLAPDVDLNEAEEYETWKVREIARIKRDRDNREAMSKNKEEIVRIRNMTEEEICPRKPAAPTKQKLKSYQYIKRMHI